MKDIAARAISDLEDLASGLRRSSDIDGAVHATRTGIKRLRAFVRLARASIGADTYRFENGNLRDAARLIAPARDALVMIETATGEDAAPAVLAALSRSHADSIEELETGVRLEAVQRLTSTANRWEHLTWGGPPPSSIRIGLRNTYLRARTDYATVLSDPTASAFHGWRRRVKYVRYQLEAIKAPQELVTPYADLGDDLGLEHDHTVLIAFCSDSPGDTDFSALGRSSSVRRAGLRIRALDLGSRLFVSTPEAFVDAVGETVSLE